MKEVVRYVTRCHGYSERRACSLTRQNRATQRQPSRRDPRHGLRQRMHGAEFTGQLVDLWAEPAKVPAMRSIAGRQAEGYHHSVRIDFSRPGKPTDNAFVETFNGSLRDECLNLHWFETIAEARSLIEAWRRDYNESRPHMALGNKTPQEYAFLVMPSRQAKGGTAVES
jgi:putative transposase